MIWSGPSANLECQSEMCWTRLAGNVGPKKSPKIAHLGTIAQLCRAISSQLRNVSTIGKKIIKQQYLLQTSSQYGELRPTSSWDMLASLGHPCKFQRVSRLGTLVVGVSQTAVLNRGRHLYSSYLDMSTQVEPARTWSQTFSKPNSITLSWSQTVPRLIADLSRPASSF